MKFRVSMKDPDALDDQLRDAVTAEVEKLGLEEEEAEALAEAKRAKVRTLCGTWFKWGEYLVVEIDTEAKTCTVVPC